MAFELEQYVLGQRRVEVLGHDEFTSTQPNWPGLLNRMTYRPDFRNRLIVSHNGEGLPRLNPPEITRHVLLDFPTASIRGWIP